MTFAEQKVKLFKIVADADEHLVNAMLRKFIEYYTENTNELSDDFIKAIGIRYKISVETGKKLENWKKIKEHVEAVLIN